MDGDWSRLHGCDLRGCDARFERVRRSRELHGTGGSAKSRDRNLEGDLGGRYDEVGFCNDHGDGHSSTDHGEFVTDYRQCDGERYASFHGDGG